jgi:hypothetical protein
MIGPAPGAGQQHRVLPLERYARHRRSEHGEVIASITSEEKAAIRQVAFYRPT